MRDIHSLLEEKRAQTQKIQRDIEVLTAALTLLNQEDGGRNISNADPSTVKRPLPVSNGNAGTSPKPEKDKINSQFP